MRFKFVAAYFQGFKSSGCDARPLVQRFPTFRKTIMSPFSGSSSPWTDSLTLQIKALFSSETLVTVYSWRDVSIREGWSSQRMPVSSVLHFAQSARCADCASVWQTACQELQPNEITERRMGTHCNTHNWTCLMQETQLYVQIQNLAYTTCW
jgi:hypothetical protein